MLCQPLGLPPPGLPPRVKRAVLLFGWMNGA